MVIRPLGGVFHRHPTFSSVQLDGGGSDGVLSWDASGGYPAILQGGVSRELLSSMGGLKLVEQKGDLPDPSGGVITLEAGVTYFIAGDIDLTGDRLVTNGVVTLVGTSSETASITSTGLTAGVPLLTSRYTLPVRFITFRDVDTGIYMDDNGGANAPLALDWVGVNFLNVPNIGEIGAIDNFIYDTGAFLNAQNLRFAGTIGTVGINNSLLRGTGGAGSLINFTSTAVVTRRARTIYSSIIAFGSTVGYTINAAATIPVEGFMLDTVNFSGGGTYVSGLTSSDNKARWVECRGVSNSLALSGFYMFSNATATTIGSAGVFTKVLGTTTSNALSEKSTNTDNRATYTGALGRKFRVSVTATLSSGNNDVIGIAIAKNGSVLADSPTYLTASGAGRVENATCQTLVSAQTNDYIEVFVTNVTDLTDVTVLDLNVIIENVT